MSDTVFFSQIAPRASLAKAAGIQLLTFATASYEILREWRHNYRSRRELAAYSRHERHDLNFSGEVDAEIAKPFWKK